MGWIPDASVAFKLYFEEPGSDKVNALLRKDPEVLAPDLLVTEVGAAAVKKARNGLMSAAQAEQAIEKIAEQITRRVPAEELGPLAVEMAMELGHGIHDCLYLALAKLTGESLITDDIAFHRKVARSRWRENILLLADCE